jgi:hypothetical protein
MRLARKTLCILALRLVCFASICVCQSPALEGDESGTLIMASRTSDAVVVSADSKISHNGRENYPTNPTDGQRKLVDVGDKSGCAIAGFLGQNTPNLDVASALRSWVENHPHVEAKEALNGLLEAAAKAWDRESYPLAELAHQHRRVGSSITKLLCGSFIDGAPYIVRGETLVKLKEDDPSSQVADQRTLSPLGADLLYIEGEIDTKNLVYIIQNPSQLLARFPELLNRHPELSDFIFDVNRDINSNADAMEAFEKWQVPDNFVKDAGKNMELNNGPMTNQVPSLSWNQSDIKTLFAALYSTVEHYSSEVGSPNNLRVIHPCGRLSGTVDASEWPTCPQQSPQAAQPSQEGKKHHWFFGK